MTRKLDLSSFIAGVSFAGWANGVAEKCGFSVTRAVNSLKSKRQETLNQLGIETVLDIGANTGQWARELRGCGYSGRIISFEPVPEAFTRLKALAESDRKHACVNAALGNRDGEAELLVTNSTVNSSLRMPIQGRASSNGAEIHQRIRVPIRRLDDVLPTLAPEPRRFYMKIDTQGFEREVLAGATRTLLQTDAVEVELSLAEMYAEQALLPEIWQMLVSSGLRPAWVERGYRDPKNIWLLQVDGLFIREEAWNAKSSLP